MSTACHPTTAHLGLPGHARSRARFIDHAASCPLQAAGARPTQRGFA